MSEDSVAGSEISVTFSVTLRCGRPRGAEVSAAGSDGVESLTSPVRKVAGRLPAFWSDAVSHPPAGKCSPSENPAPDGEAGHASVKCQVLLPLDLPVMGWVLPRV